MTPIENFVDLLALEPITEDRFVARTPGDEGHLFGGLTFGLAARAAMLTVDDDRELYAATCQYVSGGTGGLDLEVDVERIRDGRSLSLRRVRVTTESGRRLLFSCDAWFAPDGGDEDWQPEPPPHDLDRGTDFTPMFGIPIDPIEVRSIRSAEDINGLRIHPFWARSRQPIGDDRSVQIGALAFLSDLYTIGLMSPPDTPPDAPFSGYSVTLNHSLWVHRPVHLDEWVRVEGQLESIHGNRGFSTGSIHDESGALIASFAQESMRRG